MSQKLIYAVEDEINIRELIKHSLELNGFKVVTFPDSESALSECKSTLPSLFILDIMLPGMDGLELCKKLRQDMSTKKIPVILLTAKSDEFDRVLGLELGADDYITKPFSVRELVARVKAILRRIDNIDSDVQDVIKYGNISIDFAKREVLKENTLIDLSFKEFELLKLLIINKGRVLTRELLLEKIWGYDFYGETRTIDVHIRYLRQKIEDDANNPTYIETVRSVGYRFSWKWGDLISMQKKIFLYYMVLIIIGITVTGIFISELSENFYKKRN